MVGVALAPLIPGGWGALAAVAAISTLCPLALLLWMRTRGVYPGRWTRLLVIRPFWYLLLTLLLLGPVAALGAAGGALVGSSVAAEQVALATGAAMLAVLLLAGYMGSRRLVVRPLTIPLAGLPVQFEGLRIAQISDLHVGPHTPRWFMARVARLVRESRPDMIVVTGDLVDDFARDADVYATAFGDMAAPDGVYAIPGNHDIYAGWPAVRARLERLPLRVLVNDVHVIRRGGAMLAVLGTGDPAAGGAGTMAGGAEVEIALRRVPPGALTVALAHNPALWPGLVRGGVELTLSGHTHYGQFAIPGLGWSLASPFLRHAMGLYREGRSWLYINPGTNYWGIPFRFGTPPEVTVVELRREDGGRPR